MRFEELLAVIGDEPLFETGLLLAGDVDPSGVRRQLSRWMEAGRLLQLRRGLYTLAPPFQKVRPHPFLQNLDGLDAGELRRLAEASGKPKLRRAAERIAHLVEVEAEECQPL